MRLKLQVQLAAIYSLALIVTVIVALTIGVYSRGDLE